MSSYQGLRHPFVVAGEASEACRPGEAAFDHPTTGQENEAAFGLRVLNHCQFDAMGGSRLLCGLSGVPLIDIR